MFFVVDVVWLTFFIVAIAYQVPDIDGKARIMVNRTGTREMIACVVAPLSNGKTVDSHGVGWATAIIAGMGLIASAVTSGLGHSNTAAHVAANALSLFGYFQAQAMIGMTAVELPPVVASWTQNFDWSMGIIKVDFMQDILHWYIQATGGTPSNLFGVLSEVSVQVMKRSLDVVQTQGSRAAMYGFDAPRLVSRSLETRSNSQGLGGPTQTIIKVSGIHRVAFKGEVEATNFFMTGLAFFIAFLALVALGVMIFKGLCEGAAKMGWIKGSKFLDFRNGWLTVLKGIMYRLVCPREYLYPPDIISNIICRSSLVSLRWQSSVFGNLPNETPMAPSPWLFSSFFPWWQFSAGLRSRSFALLNAQSPYIRILPISFTLTRHP